MTVKQFKRRASLMVLRAEQTGNNPSAFVPGSAMDLSAFQFTFKTAQQDVESPNSCSIRVFNLSDATVQAITKFEYSRVVLQAGYDGGFGVIFDGTIKQFRIGRVSATTTYLDLLAADGDIAYNYATMSKTFAAGWTQADVIKDAAAASKPFGATLGHFNEKDGLGGVVPNPRGKVAFGMARAFLRTATQHIGSTWNISNGQINVVPLEGYLPGEAVELSAATGLIGLPEQTNEGVRVRCLLNPRIVVGGLVHINNKSVNQITQQNPAGAPIPYNQYAAVQLLAKVTSDGIYRVYVAEHDGDTRGPQWYTDLVCLAVDLSTKKVVAQ